LSGPQVGGPWCLSPGPLAESSLAPISETCLIGFRQVCIRLRAPQVASRGGR
jgi:hypothetical protein